MTHKAECGTGILPVRGARKLRGSGSSYFWGRLHGQDARATFTPFVFLLLCVLCANSAVAIPPPQNKITAAERQQLGAGADALGKEIDALAASLAGKPELLALLPDVRIYHKAVDWP